MKRFKICRKKEYESQGQKKTAWLPVGTILEFDNGGLGLELNHTSEKFYVFEDKPRTQESDEQNIPF